MYLNERREYVSAESLPSKALVVSKPEQLCGMLLTGRWGGWDLIWQGQQNKVDEVYKLDIKVLLVDLEPRKRNSIHYCEL